MNKTKLIFYQSIAEISEILEIMKKSPKTCYHLVITGGSPLAKLIKKLSLKKKFNIKIYEFHALELKNPINIIKMFYKFNFSKLSKKLLNQKYDEVIFFSYAYDFVTPIFIEKVNSSKITFINFYQRKFKNGNPKLKEKIQIILIKFLQFRSNLIVKYDKDFGQINFFQIKKKIYERKLSNRILTPFLNIDSLKIKKNVIYLDSNEELLYGENCKKIILKLFNLLKRNKYNIIVKKHPVGKLSKSIQNIKNIKYILDPFPIEFYKIKNIDFVFGFYSLSLAKVAEKNLKIKVVSISKLINSRENHFNMKNYLRKKTKYGKILYPADFNLIENLTV